MSETKAERKATWLLAHVLWAIAALSFALPAPGQLSVGGQSLHRATQATRQILFMDIYRVTMALPEGTGSLEAATSRRVPKAFVVTVLYEESVPGNVPDTWQEELLPALPEEDERTLRRAYMNLSGSDRIAVTYAPDQGTELHINERQILADPRYELMGAFIDLWLGDRPVSEELRQSLLAGLDAE